MLSALAILCMRNESRHVEACIQDLVDDDISVHVIDHSSTDDSAEIARSFLGNGVEAVETMAWEGCFSLSDQMRAKERVSATAKHDWLIHIDADERLTSPVDGRSLHRELELADEFGSNCLNFEEFVFIPGPGQSYERPGYRSEMTDYYFFEPSRDRLMRAFKRTEKLRAWQEAGHLVYGEDLKIHPINMVSRHYLTLSEAHFEATYATRRYSLEDLERGWHGNRLAISRYALPDPANHSCIKSLPTAESCSFERAAPAREHFWQWDEAVVAQA